MNPVRSAGLAPCAVRLCVIIAGTGSVPAPRPEVLQDDHAYYVVLLAARWQ